MDLQGLLVRDRSHDTLLYAGSLKVRITDWFIFKDQADLKYIGLEDAVIKTRRTDSVWNYQFIIDYFSSPSDGRKSQKKGKTISLDLKKLDLKNIALLQQDDWRGETMVVKMASLVLDGNNMDFSSGNLDVAELTLDRPYFELRNYPGLRPYKKPSGGLSLDLGVLLKIERLELNNGTFVNERQTDRKPYPYFDGNHMVISRINGTVTNLSFVNDTIRGRFDIAAKERSGFELKRLQTDFRFDTERMVFANLDLETPRSRIRDYFSMRYQDFDEDMSNFVTAVTMNARFRQSEIHGDDLAYFAPGMRSWKRVISASGNFSGTVSNLKGTDVSVRTGNSFITGNVTAIGLPDINRTSFGLNGTFGTNYNDLAGFVPDIRTVTTPDLKSLGAIRFNGSFNGTINRFRARGNVNTNLGNAFTDISMHLPARGLPTYSGSVNTQRFDLGRFLNIPRLGDVTLNGRIDGTGFHVNTLRTTFDGSIASIQYGDYTFQNINTNGTFQRGAFAGEVRINDPNLNFTSNIAIDFNGDQPHFQVLGDVANANLQALKLTRERFDLAGLFDLDFTGTNIDDFLGSAKLINASLLHDNTRLSFDSLSIQTAFAGDDKILSIRSNEIDAVVTGRYSILDLPNSFQRYLHNYFPSYIAAPYRIPEDQRFTIDITTRNISDFVRIIDQRLEGFDHATITGSINTTRPDSGFVIHTDVPYFRYDRFSFSNINFDGIGDAVTLRLDGEIELVTIGDSLYFPNTTLHIASTNDISSVSIQTKANNTLNEADLNATVQTMEDGVQINFRPSSFVINDARWTLEREGELILRKYYVAARDIKFYQGFQEITISTRTPPGGNVDELVVNLKDIHLHDFIHFATRDPRMQGLVTGEVVLTDFFDQLTAEANLTAREFRLDDDSMGVVNIEADYARKTGKVNFTVRSANEPYNLTLEGSYNTLDSLGKPLATTLRLNRTRISFINRFLSAVFSDIDGLATGNLRITGDINRPQLVGKVRLEDAGMLVNYTQVYYNIARADIDFREDRIDFGQFNLSDKLGNTGLVRGILYNRAFEDMRFDFDLSTNRMLLLDTRPTDNENFYGRALGRATLNIRGPADNIQMNILGELNDTSHIFIPTSNSRESAEADFIVFRQPGREVRVVNTATTNITVDLDVIATNKAAIDVILDPLAGDVLKARGNGRLRIHAGTLDAVTMHGRYIIEQGSYDFNFQSLLRRPFTINPSANNYIEWTGNPYDAEIHVDAMYTADNVSLSDLLVNRNYNLESSARAYRGDVFVIAAMRDKLSQPRISFTIDFPSNMDFMNDVTFREFLSRLQTDENELNKQVSYLLLFNTFAPYGGGGNLAQLTSAVVYNSISQFLNRQINNAVSDWFFKVTGVRFDFNASIYSSASLVGGGGLSQQTALANLDRLGLGLRFWRGFLNNRIILNVGGNLDFTRFGAAEAFQSGNTQFLPDINVEFVLDPRDKVRLIIFQRNTLDINTGNSSLGRRNRTGVSISYSKDFD